MRIEKETENKKRKTEIDRDTENTGRQQVRGAEKA